MSSVCDPNPSFRSDGFVFLEKIFFQTLGNIFCDDSLDAVGGGDHDGRVAGEERGAAAVPALVVAQHGHVPRQLPRPRLAPCTRAAAAGHVPRVSSPPTTWKLAALAAVTPFLPQLVAFRKLEQEVEIRRGYCDVERSIIESIQCTLDWFSLCAHWCVKIHIIRLYLSLPES